VGLNPTLRTSLLSPVPLHLDGLLVPWPPRHGGDDELEGLLTGVPELEPGTGGNAYTHPGFEHRYLLPVPLSSPHLASASDAVPYLLDGPMVDGVRRLMRRQRAVGQLAAAHPHENPYLGAVGSELVVLPRQPPDSEVLGFAHEPHKGRMQRKGFTR